MSETYGVPRMQPVYNRLIDLRKILSGSGEMFWKGAFPGISFEVNPELVDQGVTLDPESMRKEFERYENGLQRYLATTGVTAKSLQIQVSSPKDHVEAHMSAIAVTLGIPKRILFGSEQAQLASSQDAMAWNKRVNRRQTKYVTPLLIQPIVDRLIAFSVMPGPVKSYKIDWPDLDSPTDADKAQIALQKTQALAAYVTGGVDQLIPPKPYLTMILDMTPEEADVIEEKAEGYAADNPPGQTDENGNPVGNPIQQTDRDGNPIVPGASGPVPVGGAAGGTGGNNAPSNAGSLRTEGGVPGKQKPIKKGPQMQRGTATTPSSYPGGLGQPMPPYSIPPGAGVGGGTPAVPISGQKQRGKVQGTQQKEYPQKASSVKPQGKPGPAETSVHRGKVSPSNPGGGGPKTKGNKQRRLKASEQPGKREKGKPDEPFTH
jgi:hypothetical protein